MVVYRLIFYIIIGVSLVEFLFGRKMCIKLFELKGESIESEMWDKDGEMKVKVKWYVDKKWNV